MDHTIGMILKFKELGFHKIITTPHVMQDCYPNTPESIRLKLNEVKDELNTLAISMEFEASAEYNVEDSLFEKLEAGTILPFARIHDLIDEYLYNLINRLACLRRSN